MWVKGQNVGVGENGDLEVHGDVQRERKKGVED